MSHSKLHFYDASNSHNVPSGVHAAVYMDGEFAWTESEIKRMGPIFRITVLGGVEAAHKARSIDIEKGNPAYDPERFMPFLIERSRHYGDATPYCDRSDRPMVEQHCERAGILHLMRFWIATLDGTQDVEGAWAVQYSGGFHSPFDISVLHGRNDFHKAA